MWGGLPWHEWALIGALILIVAYAGFKALVGLIASGDR